MAEKNRTLFPPVDAGSAKPSMIANAPKARASSASKTISDLPFPEAILAVKESISCRDLSELQARLCSRLGQNSQETRLRYSRFVIKWFFSDGLNGLARKTWMAYEDDRLLIDVLRYLYLANEPVMGACVAECLFPVESGMRLPGSVFDRFLSTYYSGAQTKKTTQRLKSNLMRVGMSERCQGEDDKLNALTPSKTSLILLTHHIFAPTGPRTIELLTLLANPFWRYLGFKREDEIRAILREADAVGHIGKYVVADQLEQVTTCLTLDAFLSQKVRI